MVEQAEKVIVPDSSRWFVSLSDSGPATVSGYNIRRLGPDSASQSLYLGNEDHVRAPLCAEGRECAVVVGGVLFNWTEIRDELCEPEKSAASNGAEVVLSAYARWGEDFLSRLRGQFAVIVWDWAEQKLLCVRDPLGSHPLFRTKSRQPFLTSPSIQVLLDQPSVSRKVNRIVMAEYVAQRFQKPDETFYEDISRIPAGHVFTVKRSSTSDRRYWDPAPDENVAWLKPQEVERFDEVFDTAVSRCLSLGPTSVFLSGGLDSVSVAAVALERSRAEGLPKPLALSLAFPDPETNEETVQRGVARQLGLAQVVKPFREAIGDNGLLSPAMALSASLPAPLLNIWLPAYAELAREGAKHGCNVVLTGNGGDEWLTLGPFIAADLLRSFDLVGFYRLWQSHRKSYRLSALPLLRNLLWRFGLAPIVAPPVHRLVKRVAPWSIKLRHRVAPAEWMPAKWVAPDAALRYELLQRMEQSGEQQEKSRSFYDRAGRVSLSHSLMSWETEELFVTYQRAGVRVMHPFWDADLVDLLYRTPPFMLNSRGRTKGLVRDSLDRRFPSLGFERQQKVLAVNFYKSTVARESSSAWKQMGGAGVLESLGIIDEKLMRSDLAQRFAEPRSAKDAFRIWSVLNLESWARAHVS